jgi:hypothetical protein
MLERERLRVERSKTGPDWVIDLDDMEVGIKEWTRSTKSRVVLMLGGEPAKTAFKENTLLKRELTRGCMAIRR